MGAWGTGIFEDDISCDLIYEAMVAEADTFISRAAKLIDRDYLEYDDGQEIIVSGVILDSILNGTKYQHNSEEFNSWLTQQTSESVSKFKPKIVKGLKLVLSDNSELNELWRENEGDYYTWKSNIEKMIKNLK